MATITAYIMEIWTKTPPSEPGYYWWRKYKYKNNGMFYVWREVTGLMYCRWLSSSLCDKQLVSEAGGEWIGPVIPPDDIDKVLDCRD